MEKFEYPKIGVGALILDAPGERVLMILRKKEPEANSWSIPGGKVELFETLEEATKREIAEEIGVVIEIEELWCTAETINEKEHYISVIYKAVIDEGHPNILEPSAIGDMRWFALRELPKNLACFTVPAIEKLRIEGNKR